MKYIGHIKYRSLFFLFFFIFLSTATFMYISISPKIANADDLNPGVYAIDSKPFGASYGEWIARFFNWTAQIPAQVHPTSAYTPERCSTNQTGPVWFLAESFTGTQIRTCTIPSDKAILLPTMSGIQFDQPNDDKTYEMLLQNAITSNEGAVITAELDGMEIKNLKEYRAHSPPFNITLVNNNIWDDTAGVWEAAADGYFVFLEPLTVGKHTLKTTVYVDDPEYPTRNYAATLIYNLNIVK